MKLDPRIIKGKKPLDCFDVDIARQFVGKKGLFGTHESQFMDLDTHPKCAMGELKDVDGYDDHPFTTIGNGSYRLFLPAEWVKEPEKKYRPFSLTEWRHEYGIGDEIVFRLKGSDTCKAYMYCGLISDKDDDSPGKGVINLGGELFVLQNLFDQFELRRNDDWQPFGKEGVSE